MKPILVVEDDPDLSAIIAEILQMYGYPVVTAANGQQALAKLRAADSLPSLILLDLMMPVMDGWEFRAEQRRDPHLAQVPVVVISAHLKAREAARELDARAWLQKPLELDQLLRIVRESAAPSPDG